MPGTASPAFHCTVGTSPLRILFHMQLGKTSSHDLTIHPQRHQHQSETVRQKQAWQCKVPAMHHASDPFIMGERKTESRVQPSSNQSGARQGAVGRAVGRAARKAQHDGQVQGDEVGGHQQRARRHAAPVQALAQQPHRRQPAAHSGCQLRRVLELSGSAVAADVRMACVSKRGRWRCTDMTAAGRAPAG
jgi:hypothetical protein